MVLFSGQKPVDAHRRLSGNMALLNRVSFQTYDRIADSMQEWIWHSKTARRAAEREMQNVIACKISDRAGVKDFDFGSEQHPTPAIRETLGILMDAASQSDTHCLQKIHDLGNAPANHASKALLDYMLRNPDDLVKISHEILSLTDGDIQNIRERSFHNIETVSPIPDRKSYSP